MRSGGKGASPGDLSLLFHIEKVVALVLFGSQDVAPPFDKPKLSLQRYMQLHVLSIDCNNNIYKIILTIFLFCNWSIRQLTYILNCKCSV